MADKLKRYRDKRDFALTPEPAADVGRSSGVLRFVVQKHAATRLHYDFRLEYEGVLKSWAVTRGPSRDPQEKRLAVETEDHPLDYATFEGTIPKGEYGGGTVMVWDEGTWAMVDGKDAAEGLAHGSLSFELFGKRMKGRWHLQRMHAEANRPPQWLLVKTRDAEARDPGAGKDLIDAFTDSAATGRSMDEIAAGAAVWHSRGRSEPAPEPPKPTRGEPAEAKRTARATDERERSDAPADEPARRGRAKTDVPEFVEPALCTSRAAPPKGKDWLAEVKYDGYRALLRAVGGEVRILTRSNKDWTARFPAIARAAEHLAGRDMLLDGEIVVFEDDGRTRFDALQKAFRTAEAIAATYVAFDCLFDRGADLRGEPIEARKAVVAELFGQDGPIRYGDHIAGRQEALFAHAAELGLEGIVAKRAGSTYRSGRHETWVKVQARLRAPFVVGGWAASDKERGLGALVLGAFDGDDLVPVGRVGTGFSHAELERLKDDLGGIAADRSPFAMKVEGRRNHFVAPERVADVSYLTITDDGQLRHAVYHGMLDMDAKDVTLPSGHPLAQVDRAPAEGLAPRRSSKDKAAAAGTKAEASAAPRRKAKTTAAAVPEGAVVQRGKTTEVLGVPLTHPDKVLFDDQRVTKLALAEHYLKHMDRMLPHIAGRPLTLVRCPQGAAAKCFYQRHPEGLPERMARDVGEEDGLAIVVAEPKDVIELVQRGVLEIHLRGARADKPDVPDRLVFDLDPGEGVDFAALKAAAVDLRAALAKLDLEAFVKTTGGKGLHVVVPVERRVAWDEAKAWTRAFSEAMADAEPTRFLITMQKAKRKNRIFIDYLRNDRKASAVAPYSSRARPGAPFSFPVTWEELAAFDVPAPLHVGDVASGDPWADMGKVRQRLTSAHLKAIR